MKKYERLEKENKLLQEANDNVKRLNKEIRELEKVLKRKRNTLDIYKYEVEMEKKIIKKIEKENS